MKKYVCACLFVLHCIVVFSQESHNVRYSSINPALTVYKPSDVYINSPAKYRNGAHLISPNPALYPWEEHLENGMPNVIVDKDGNTSVYISSFIGYRREGGSKVGAMVYTNKSGNLNLWSRPDAGLYWYNESGTTPDEKFVPTKIPGSTSTNIVAVDIESAGVLEEIVNGQPVLNWIYLPQRESKGDLLGAYRMDKTFTDKGILQGFSQMKADRTTRQSLLRFRYINGGTHLNLYKSKGKYYVNARLNTKRSELLPGEVPPFRPWDGRKRFRRELVAEIGSELKSSKLEYEVGLDMSTLLWEPYSIQSFQLPGFENDIHWGIVTMYGTDYNPNVEMLQRTELAFSVDGKHWTYAKPGVPFLDNGTDPKSDDFGCINMGKPVMGAKFFNDSGKLLYFYASSNYRHIITRQTGVSLATGDFGKLAGIRSQPAKFFQSVNPKNNPVIETTDMVSIYPGKAFELGKTHYPYVLADITQDPRDKKVSELDSYVEVSFYAYDPSISTGRGDLLVSVLGSSIKGTETPSAAYECVAVYQEGKDMTDKERILEYIRKYSREHPTEIVDFNTMAAIPVIVETTVKNATFYGIEFKNLAKSGDMAVDFTNPMNINKQNLWEYHPASPVAGTCQSFDFTDRENIPNMRTPVDLSRGAFALKVTPATSNTDQVILKMSGDEYNYLSVSYLKNGNFQFLIQKDSIAYNKLEIAPPTGKSFTDHSVILTIEGTPQRYRKYLEDFTEDAAVMRVKVNELGFEKTVHEPYIWNWNHDPGEITPGDSTVARTAGYVPFTSFVAHMTRLHIGGNNDACDKNFKGTIEQIEVSDGLPAGNLDFWDASSFKMPDMSFSAGPASTEREPVFITPNPVRKGEILRCRLDLDRDCTLRLVDISGRVVESRALHKSGNGIAEFKTSDLSTGVYVVVIRSKDFSTARKVLVVN